MIVDARSPSLICLPSTLSSLLSVVLQKRWVSTVTLGLSAPSSVASIRRPRIGCSPITRKNEPPTTPARTTRGSPRPTSVKSSVEKSPNCEIVFTRDFKSLISGTDQLAFSVPRPVAVCRM